MWQDSFSGRPYPFPSPRQITPQIGSLLRCRWNTYHTKVPCLAVGQAFQQSLATRSIPIAQNTRNFWGLHQTVCYCTHCELRTRTGTRHVGAPVQMLHWCGKPLWWRLAQVADNFRKIFSCLWKPGFSITIFPIIPVRSQRPLYVRATGTCPAEPPLMPAAVGTST